MYTAKFAIIEFVCLTTNLYVLHLIIIVIILCLGDEKQRWTANLDFIFSHCMYIYAPVSGLVQSLGHWPLTFTSADLPSSVLHVLITVICDLCNVVGDWLVKLLLMLWMQMFEINLYSIYLHNFRKYVNEFKCQSEK